MGGHTCRKLHQLARTPSLHSESADWNRLVELYTPLIRSWLLRHDVSDDDADDLTQDVLGVVVRELVDFQHNQRLGAFRTWLRPSPSTSQGYWRGRQHSPQAGGDSDVRGGSRSSKIPTAT